MRAQEAMTEAVDRRDPRTIEGARQIGSPALDEPRPNPGAQLTGRLLGVRDHEDRLDVDSLVAHRTGEALYEHLRFPRSSSG